MTTDFVSHRIDLALETDFRLGSIDVRPSTRRVESGGIPETLEPRVMQALVALTRRRGHVVSRDELIETCWEGRIVGDDALNRCISKVRKVGESTGAFRLETIPRVGYCLHETNATAGPSTLGIATMPSPPAVRSRRALAAIAVGIAALVFVLIGWMALGRGNQRIALEPSIAVLPFANLTGDPEKDYIARGVAVEIIDRLSQLEGVNVISRNSSFTFGADADPRIVGTDLNVANVLSGTVREEGGRIFVSADLADAKTGAAILQPFSHELAAGDPYAVQRLIAQRVAGAMSIAFDVDKRARPSGSSTRSLEAYDLYLRGFDEWWYKFNRQRSADLFAEAVELDPTYADAWAGRAIAIASRWGSLPPAEAQRNFAEAYRMALRAVDLDPNLSDAQAILGAISTTQRKWDDAEAATLKALKIARSEMALNHRQMFLLRSGRTTAALATMRELQQVDPLRGPDEIGRVPILSSTGRHDELREMMSRPGWSDAELDAAAISRRFFVVIARINAGDPPAAVRQGLEAIARRQERAPAEFSGAVLAVFDDPVKARAVLRSWYDDPNFQHSIKWDLIPILAAWYGDTDLVLRVWQDELPVNSARLTYVWGPAFSQARSTPEFKALVQKLGLVDFWRTHGWPDACRPVGDNDFACA